MGNRGAGPGEGPVVGPLQTPVPSDAERDVGSSEDSVLTVDFNEVRMGSGIGPEWRQTAGRENAVAVAAFPTAVNRSARLETLGGDQVETCQSLDPPISNLHLLSVDVLLPTDTATAVVSVGVGPGRPALRIDLATSGSTLTDGDTHVLADGEGVKARSWYRVEIPVEGTTTLWRVTPLDGSLVPLLESEVGTRALDSVGEVCLAASGASQDAVHFDNLRMSPSEGG